MYLRRMYSEKTEKTTQKKEPYCTVVAEIEAHKVGVYPSTLDMTIKDRGRWESLEMVQRYTRSVTFQDSLKHYRAPLS